jgi:hypothetical protein
LNGGLSGGTIQLTTSDQNPYYFCVTNTGSNSYYLPTRTGTEVNAFRNAVNSGSLPGLSAYDNPVNTNSGGPQ